jgi:hypothetical protein
MTRSKWGAASRVIASKSSSRRSPGAFRTTISAAALHRGEERRDRAMPWALWQ